MDINGLASLGVGGALAIVIFWIYRQDKQTTEDRLTTLLNREIESREAYTTAVTELTALLKSLNGKVTEILCK